jgi:hypothetical protein
MQERQPSLLVPTYRPRGEWKNAAEATACVCHTIMVCFIRNDAAPPANDMSLSTLSAQWQQERGRYMSIIAKQMANQAATHKQLHLKTTNRSHYKIISHCKHSDDFACSNPHPAIRTQMNFCCTSLFLFSPLFCATILNPSP